MAGPLREMGVLIQAAVLAKAQRPLRRNAHHFSQTLFCMFIGEINHLPDVVLKMGRAS